MVLSIEISESTAYAAVGKCRNGKVRLWGGGRISLPGGTVSGGRISDRSEFRRGVNEFLLTQPKRPRKASVSVISGLSLYKDFALPVMPESELSLIIKNEMLQQISSDIRYRVDYTYMRRQGNTLRLMAYAIPEDLIAELKSVLNELHLHPLKLDVSCNCLNRLVSHSTVNGLPIDNEAAIIAEIGVSALTCNLFADGHLEFVRTAPISVKDLERSLSKLGRSIAPNDALSSFDFSPENLDQDILFYEASRRYLGGIVEELYKMVNYQVSRKASDPVRRIFIYGTASLIKGFPEYLSSALNLPVAVIESLERAFVPEGLRLTEAVNSIGTILER